MRARNRRRTRGARSSIIETPQQISGLAAWFDSRSTFWMAFGTGISAWTSRATGVDAIADVVLTQVTGFAQPTYEASASPLGNKPAVRFDGSNDAMSQGVGRASDWTFLHNGTGGSIFFVEYVDSTGAANQTPLATCTGTNAVHGVFENMRTADLTLRVSNGSGTSFTNNWVNATAAHWAKDTFRWRSWSYTTGTQSSHVSGSSVSNADIAAPSATAPSSGLAVGGIGGVFFKGYIAQILIYRRVLDATDRARLGAWASSNYPTVAA